MLSKHQTKRREILEAAMPVFLDRGFRATTMSDISVAAGGTKQTLYRYFQSKEQLFLSVLNELGAELILSFVGPAAEDNTLNFKQALKRLGTQFLSAMNKSETIAFRRIVIAEGAYSGLGHKINETGIKRGLSLIAGYFETLMLRQTMKGGSSWDAAIAFAALLESGELTEFLEGARGALTTTEIETRVDTAVSIFVSHYAVDEGSTNPD